MSYLQTLKNHLWRLPLPLPLFLFFICSICLGYWLFIKNNLDHLRILQNKEIALRHEFEVKQRQSAYLNDEKMQALRADKHFKKQIQAFTTLNEIPNVLNDISKKGLEGGLSFDLFSPKAEVQHDFYIELPIEITVVGYYSQLTQFLSQIAHLRKLISWHDFVIKQHSLNASRQLLSMNITAKIYRLIQ